MLNILRIAVLCVSSFFISSCAMTKAMYLGPDDYARRTAPSLTGEAYHAENVNGFFPEAVYIKTRTQTFNSYHYYILHRGKIWYKSVDPEKEPEGWTLFAGTGIPHDNYRQSFIPTGAVKELSADADELMALSEEGGFYRYCFDRSLPRRRHVWHDRQGWPSKEHLYFDPRTAGNLSWALGKRNPHVLYYEDIFGNQHHNGTMEIATTYVLLEDGQEICYADTGLPSDFSRNFAGPERGAFKAVALSASGSTMFVINEAGEMYTRLADFDTVGCDPMWFKYTYEPYKSDLPGTNYFSNLNEWGLPSEDWLAQPRIPLTGKAALTRHITILQNGQGNAARELRVAGLNEAGEYGFWTKAIFAQTWEFRKVPLYFLDSSILKDAAPGDQNALPRGERGTSPDKRYSGYRWDNGGKENDWNYVIPNFNILEGDCDLRITRGDETCVLKLHPVEMWTYLKREYSPGRTGAPKMFLVTLEIPPQAFDGLSEDFIGALSEKFGKNNRKLFHYIMTASGRFIMMNDIANTEAALFLTDGSISDYYPHFRRIRYVEDYDEMKYAYSPALVLNPGLPVSGEELAQKAALNQEFIDKLKYRIRSFKWAGVTAMKINVSYLPFHSLAVITPLRFIDMPKIRTMTRYGGKLVLANSTYIDTVSTVYISVIERIIQHLELRLLYYHDMEKYLAEYRTELRENHAEFRGLEVKELPPSSWYAEDLSDYWNLAGLPQTIAGTFHNPHRWSMALRIPETLTFVPSDSAHGLSGWYFTIGGGSDVSIIIDPQKSAEKIYSRQGKTPGEQTVQLDGALYINGSTEGSAEQSVSENERIIIDQCLKPFISEGRDSVKVRISFDGEYFEIREHPSFHNNSLIFRGVLSTAEK